MRRQHLCGRADGCACPHAVRTADDRAGPRPDGRSDLGADGHASARADRRAEPCTFSGASARAVARPRSGADIVTIKRADPHANESAGARSDRCADPRPDDRAQPNADNRSDRSTDSRADSHADSCANRCALTGPNDAFANAGPDTFTHAHASRRYVDRGFGDYVRRL
jgi:hypothetical protein